MIYAKGIAVIPDFKQIVYRVFEATSGTAFVTQEGEWLDRSKVLNASEAGKCLRQIVFSKQHPEIVEASFATLDQAGYAQRGHSVEAWFAKRFAEHNALFSANGAGYFEDFGEEQVSWGYKNLSATPDAVFTQNGKAWNVDVKSIDPRKNRAALPTETQIVQVKQAAHILRNVTSHNIVGSILMYVNASNFGDIFQHHVPYDPEFGEWIEARADTALSNTQPNQVKAEGLLTKDGCDHCPFTSLCSDAMDATNTYLANLAEAERAFHGIRKSQGSD